MVWIYTIGRNALGLVFPIQWLWQQWLAVWDSLLRCQSMLHMIWERQLKPECPELWKIYQIILCLGFIRCKTSTNLAKKKKVCKNWIAQGFLFWIKNNSKYLFSMSWRFQHIPDSYKQLRYTFWLLCPFQEEASCKNRKTPVYLVSKAVILLV